MIEQRTIKGRVLNKKTGEGISGANVVIKNTTTGTVADTNGEFVLRISPEHTAIVISYVGYQSETIPITAEDNIVVELHEKTYEINPDPSQAPKKHDGHEVKTDEVFTVVEEMPSPSGGNISYLYAEQINPEAWSIFDATHETGTVFVEYVITESGDVENARVVKSGNEKLNAYAIGIVEKTKWNPGVQRGVKVPVRAVTPVKFPPTDEPSSEAIQVKIGYPMDSSSGAKSVDQLIIKSKIDGEKQPLYIVNDEERASIEDINPGDIESISVIKGESAIAIYGEKGRDGVIIIKTKQ
jgi:TonB family protein